jgi:hypothetical protein
MSPFSYIPDAIFVFNLYNNIMKKNMGSTDKVIRLSVAAVLAALYFTGILTGTLGIVALVAAGVFTLTSLVSFCPIYPILGINTCAVTK